MQQITTLLIDTISETVFVIYTFFCIFYQLTTEQLNRYIDPHTDKPMLKRRYYYEQKL